LLLALCGNLQGQAQHIQPQGQGNTQLQAAPQAQGNTQPQAAPQAQGNTQPQATPQGQGNTQPQATPQGQGNTQPQATPQGQGNTQPQAAPQGQGNTQPQAAPQGQGNTQPQAAPQGQGNTQPQAAPQGQGNTQPQAAPQGQGNTQPQAAPQGQGNQPQTNTTTTTERPTRPPWPKPNCGNSALTNQLRRVFLDMHNDFRGRIARGQTEVSAGWGIAPPAALMYRMKYDCGAESYAQQSVASCRRTELPAYATGGHKQNLFVLNQANLNPKAVIHYALSQWWSQLARFGMRSNMMFYQSEYHRRARNVLKWAKMAWWNNRKVGCAVKKCGSFYLVSCMYSPGGLYVNQPVYRVAAVCSGCPRGQCDGQALCRW
ncbi:hypothetical protein Y032_0801g2418, partial [Ancylostoma ceylanicum]